MLYIMHMGLDTYPAASKEPIDNTRREKTLKLIRTNLTEATKRLHDFVADKTRDDIIRRVHTAKTEIINDNDDPEIITYYSLWTDFADVRITESGELLICDDAEKYSYIREHGVDRSKVVTLHQMSAYPETYKTVHLLSIANSLERFLRPKQ